MYSRVRPAVALKPNDSQPIVKPGASFGRPGRLRNGMGHMQVLGGGQDFCLPFADGMAASGEAGQVGVGVDECSALRYGLIRSDAIAR